MSCWSVGGLPEDTFTVLPPPEGAVCAWTYHSHVVLQLLQSDLTLLQRLQRTPAGQRTHTQRSVGGSTPHTRAAGSDQLIPGVWVGQDVQ